MGEVVQSVGMHFASFSRLAWTLPYDFGTNSDGLGLAHGQERGSASGEREAGSHIDLLQRDIQVGCKKFLGLRVGLLVGGKLPFEKFLLLL